MQNVITQVSNCSLPLIKSRLLPLKRHTPHGLLGLLPRLPTGMQRPGIIPLGLPRLLLPLRQRLRVRPRLLPQRIPDPPLPRLAVPGAHRAALHVPSGIPSALALLLLLLEVLRLGLELLLPDGLARALP